MSVGCGCNQIATLINYRLVAIATKLQLVRVAVWLHLQPNCNSIILLLCSECRALWARLICSRVWLPVYLGVSVCINVDGQPMADPWPGQATVVDAILSSMTV